MGSSQLRDASGPALALGAAVFGVMASGRLPAHAGGVVLVGALGAVGLGLLVRGGARVTVLLVAVTLTAGAGAMRARHGLEVGPVAEAARAGGRLAGWAHLVTDPVARPFVAEAVVRLHGRQVLVRAQRPVASRLVVLEAGSRVRLGGRARSLEGWERRWAHRHVAAVLDLDRLDAYGPPPSPVIRAGNHVRRLLLSGTDPLPEPERALVAGFLVGDTRGLTTELVVRFRRAGLSHLMVVSGANVAFVLGLVGPALRRFGLRGRLFGALGVLVLFASATRFEPSVLRAAVMAGLAALAAFTGRPVERLRVLMMAAVGLVLLDPFLVWSAGFRLSCAASAGIVLWARPLRDRLRGPGWVREAFGTTLAAQAGVAPVLLPTFGPMPLAAIPANVLAAPVAGPLMVWGAVAGLTTTVTGRVVPELAAVLVVPTVVMARYVLAVAAAAERVPGSIGGVPAAGVGAAALLVGFLRSRRLAGNGDAGDDIAPRATHL